MNRRFLVPLVFAGAVGLGALAWWAPRGAHTEQWPFADFQDDFAWLHGEALNQGPTSDEEVRENHEKMSEFKVDLRMESPKFKDIIEEIGRQADAAGGKVR